MRVILTYGITPYSLIRSVTIMRKPYQARLTVILPLLTSSLILSACGGGEMPEQLPAPSPSPEQMSDRMPEPMAEPTLPPAGTIVVMPSTGGGGSRKATVNVISIDASGKRIITPSVSGALTEVRLESTGSTEQVDVPVTFGHVFAAGDVGPTQTISGKLADGSTIPLQFDIKARHPDGSVRHGIVSTVLPKLSAGASASLGLMPAALTPVAASTLPSAMLGENFSAAAHVTISGLRYSASADQLLRSGRYTTWLSGPQVTEWHVSAPLTTAAGAAHPHLTARFAIRAYAGLNRARVDVTIENNWAYETAPQNFVYDALLEVGGAAVYSKSAMTHYHHARWRKVFWWGAEPQVHVRHNTAYLIDSRAVPNYDRSIVVPETTLASLKTGWTGAKTEPMGVGLANPYMPATGGRQDIGLLPGWAATYLLSMDSRSKQVTLGTADLAGSWSAHYRDKKTDRPVSVIDYPYMTILGNPGDTYNPVTKLREAFPVCATSTACTSANRHDSSHQPGFAYLPYLVTGDHYYLEELQFWAMWNVFSSNPGYRQNIKGLLSTDQVRGQAWSLRSLAQATYITPDNDPLKLHFNRLMDSNLDWYNANYTNNASANVLGFLINGYAIVYDGSTGIAPWQDDFFTSAVGYAADLGFTKAAPLLQWKSKFPIERMTGVGACWIDGAMYSLKVRDSATAPLYTTIEKASVATQTPGFTALECGSAAMATYLKLKVGEMTGYSSTVTGYPSNMQPALAYSSTAGGERGAQAWKQFMARTVKPNYSLGPQFAIIPR